MTALNARQRTRDLDALADGKQVDLLVIGGGITGAGVALDAAARGLRVVLVEAHDLAFGTSRWSSKLVHGGLRYLAAGRVGIAWESAVERHVLMTTIAPHLVHPYATVVPLQPSTRWFAPPLFRAGYAAADVLRIGARTPGRVLPSARHVSGAEALQLFPALDARTRGAYVAWDGQLVDDARLVVSVARTAASLGATVLTRVRAAEVAGTSARLVDTRSGDSLTISARAVINATGVWAGDVDPSVRVRPSRGTHLVLPAEVFGNPTAGITVPVLGIRNRFVFALPAPLGRVYVGITDEDAPGPVPDVPQPSDEEIDFLLTNISTALERPVTRADLLGAYSGLRPLVEAAGRTSDVSRKHAVTVNDAGVVSIVGGKLTTYRRMAEDVLDRAVLVTGLRAAECRTRSIPLLGAPARSDSRPTDGLPAGLVARHGGQARHVVETATVAEPLAPVLDGMDLTRAEIEYAVTHEGALDVDDVLERRTRIGLVAADAERARPAIEDIVAAAVHA
jgi:glycerol-3-phosphate dehydrogenase